MTWAMPFMAIGASSPALLMTHVPGVALPKPGKGTIPGQFSTANYERIGLGWSGRSTALRRSACDVCRRAQTIPIVRHCNTCREADPRRNRSPRSCSFHDDGGENVAAAFGGTMKSGQATIL